jgi:acyl carrier protein
MSNPTPVIRERVFQAILATIDEINETLPDARKLVKSTDTHLFGRQGGLVSLEFVNFIIMLEERVADEFGVAVTLADEKAISRETSPFSTVERLRDYLTEVLRGADSD